MPNDSCASWHRIVTARTDCQTRVPLKARLMFTSVGWPQFAAIVVILVMFILYTQRDECPKSIRWFRGRCGGFAGVAVKQRQACSCANGAQPASSAAVVAGEMPGRDVGCARC
jgi:hypothetical protein